MGDFNGNGRPDIAYAIKRDVNGRRVTTVRVVDALTGDLVLESIPLAEVLGVFPVAVVRAGDLNGDGLDDVALTAPLYSVDAPISGALLTFTFTP